MLLTEPESAGLSVYRLQYFLSHPELVESTLSRNEMTSKVEGGSDRRPQGMLLEPASGIRPVSSFGHPAVCLFFHFDIRMTLKKH